MTAAIKGIVAIFDYLKAGEIQSHRSVGLECGSIWRQGASNQSSCQCPGMTTVAGPSPCTEPRYSTQAKRQRYHLRRSCFGLRCLGLRCLRRGETSSACSSQDSQLQGQPGFPAVLRGPIGALHASGHRRLQVRQQDTLRVHQVDRRLFNHQQEPRSSVASRTSSTPGRSFGSIAWRPVLSKRLPLPTRRSKLACPNARGELRAPWFGPYLQTADSIVHVGGAVRGGCVPQEQDST